MKNFPPNISPRTFTSSAIFVAYLLMGDLTIDEQNAIGDWFMLVGQVLQTNASQAQVLEDRKDEEKKQNDVSSLDVIQKTLKKMQMEIDHLKRNA